MGRQANMMGQSLAVTPGKSSSGNASGSRSAGGGESVANAFDQVLAGSSGKGDAEPASRTDGKRPQPAQRETTQRETAQREAARASRNADSDRARVAADADRSANEVDERAESRLDSDEDDTDDDVAQSASPDVFALLGLTPPPPPPAIGLASAAAVAAHAESLLTGEGGAESEFVADGDLALASTNADGSIVDLATATARTFDATTAAASNIATTGVASEDAVSADVAAETQAAPVGTTATSALDALSRSADGGGINLNAANSFATIAETLARVAVPRDTAPRHTATLHAQMGSQAWARELGAQVVFMAKDDLQTASLKLSPENLGPVEVRISVRDGDATVTFGATHADTRAALEQSLPRLREMLFAQGMNLTHADVSGGSARDPSPTPASRSAPARETETGPNVSASDAGTRRAVGLLDLYA